MRHTRSAPAPPVNPFKRSAKADRLGPPEFQLLDTDHQRPADHGADARPVLAPGRLQAAYDPATGIVGVSGHGAWSEAVVRHHFAELARLLQSIRARGEPVLVLVDLRAAEHQAPHIAALVEQLASTTHAPDDRVAIMASSSLVKLQMKRAAAQSQREFFLSMNAALTWLTAWRR